MMEFRHPGQFRDRFALLRESYEERYRKNLQRIRAAYSNNQTGKPPPLVDDCLEYHARTYIINGMFEALNWPLQCADGLPALVPEAPIESLERGTRRFLDYFGLSPTSQKPLIVIEAKRPNLPLPSNEDLPEIITDGIKGDSLGKEWDAILSTLGDYVHSTDERYSYVPHRAVITNGDWLILFLNPARTFVYGNPDPGDIAVYINRNEIYERAAEIWSYLEYSEVAGNMEARSCSTGDLPFCVDVDKIKRITLGLKLIYSKAPTQYKPRPQINVLPIVLIVSQENVWIYVQRIHHQGFDLPHKYEQLGDHLREISTQSAELLAEVAQSLHRRIELSPIETHYEQDDLLFNQFKGVNMAGYPDGGVQNFVLVTGTAAHFLRETPSVVDCRYHVWNNSRDDGVAALDGPVVMPSVHGPKSFFIDGRVHHCTHAVVYTAKTSLLNQENRQQCGCRSNPDNAAFCEIIDFEEFLCCRTCVFENICTKAKLFHLPCIRQELASVT